MLDNGKHWVLEPFQEAFIADVFEGRPENWLIIPEGNAKTTLLAGLGLYHLENFPSANVTVAAASRDQARTLYRQAEGLVYRTGELHDTFECLPGDMRILCAENNGLMKVWSADDRTADGIIPTLEIIEELHRHKSLGLYLTWRGKLDKRPGAQLVAISTAGEPGSDFELARDRMRQLAASISRDGCFVRAASAETVLHEWAVPEGGDTDDLTLVKGANPLKAITLATLKSKRASPTWNKQHWNRMTCCRPTRGESAAVYEAEWDRAKSAERIPPSAPIWLSIDVGFVTDTTALVPMWVRDPEFRLLGPATVLVAPPDGTALHPNTIKKAVRDIAAQYQIATVVMDVTNARDIQAWISGELGISVQEHSQEPSAAVRDYEHFMEALRTGQLWHSGDPVLTSHVMNTAARVTPDGKVRFDKMSRQQRGSHRIHVNDALICAAMANGAYMESAGADPVPLVAWG